MKQYQSLVPKRFASLMNERQKKLRKQKGGFSLVELIVTGIIFGLAIYGLVSIISMSQRIENSSRYASVARSLLVSRMESSAYEYSEFTVLANDPDVTTEDVTIDDRGTAATSDDLVGVLKIGHELIDESSSDNVTDPKIAYVLVEGQISWDVLGVKDTVFMEKVVCQLD